MDWLNSMDEGTKKVIVTIALVAAAIGPVLIIAAIVALVAAFIYLWNNCEEFRQFWIDLWESIKEIAIAVWEALKAFFKAAWEAIKTTATTVWNAIKDFFSGLWEGIKNIFTTVVNAISTFLTTAWNTIKNTVTTVWNAIKTFFTTVWNAKKCADQNPGYKVFDADGRVLYEPKAAEPVVTAPFMVKESVPDLNIRTGPGIEHQRTGKFTGVGVFTIVEVRQGNGSSEGWGRLKSGAGWIALSLTKRV